MFLLLHGRPNHFRRGIMTKPVHTVPITQIILDEEIYPRSGVNPKRVSLFAENIRDGFEIDPIEVEIHPDYWKTSQACALAFL